MTKYEFMQEAALKILARDSESSMISIADCAAELTEEVWNRLDKEFEPEFDDDDAPDQKGEQNSPATPYKYDTVQVLAKEIARLEHEHVIKRNEELLRKGNHYRVQKAGADIRFLNICHYEGIVSVSNLLSCGRNDFRHKRNMGELTIAFVDKALESLYNIKSW